MGEERIPSSSNLTFADLFFDYCSVRIHFTFDQIKDSEKIRSAVRVKVAMGEKCDNLSKTTPVVFAPPASRLEEISVEFLLFFKTPDKTQNKPCSHPTQYHHLVT